MLQATSNLLNSSTAEFKVPTNGSTAVTAATAVTVGATSIDVHVEAINILIPKLRQITGELEEEIGRHILAIKAAEPNDWEAIVRARCSISRSRAYELMAIADGVKTTEQTRRETNARKIKYRANQAVRSGTDKKELAATDTQIIELKVTHKRELADARAQLDEREEMHERQIARFENEIAQLSDVRNLSSERDQLRKALGEIAELLAEMRGLMTHSVRNQTTITTKITRAEKIATSALKPAKVAIVNLPAKQVA
jgi:hypothetical protein